MMTMLHPRLVPAGRPRLARLGTFAFVVAVLALALPTPSLAQTIAPADVIGSWALKGGKEPTFTLRADSTFLRKSGTTTSDGDASDLKGRWRLVSDTLLIDPEGSTETRRRVLTLKDGQLTSTDPATKAAIVYERIAPSKQ